jgi:hypothetical protein
VVGDDTFIHRASNDAQYRIVEKEFGREAGRLEGHREKVTPYSAVGLLPLDVRKEHGPQRRSAGIDERRREMEREDAVAVVREIVDYDGRR